MSLTIYPCTKANLYLLQKENIMLNALQNSKVVYNIKIRTVDNEPS